MAAPTDLKILVAEDNTVNVMVLMSMLKRMGLKATVAKNGVEAVEAVQKQKFDIILSDICMPLMDGLTATQLIRKYERTGIFPAEEIAKAKASGAPAGDEKAGLAEWTGGDAGEAGGEGDFRPRTPVVAVSANALQADQDRCKAAGMDAFMSKPTPSQTGRGIE
ncbi:unnamed protein product [Closterium sp. Yama58-4]|nr:unnamed protein product [Closterium sp. Yama58-4]